MKRTFLLLIALLLIFITGCQRVSDARAEFCDNLREVGTLATEFKNAKVTDPVADFRTKVETLQNRKQTLDRLARLTNVPALDKLSTATDNVAAAVGTVSGNTLGPAAEKINAAGTELETIYLNLDEAVCAAK